MHQDGVAGNPKLLDRVREHLRRRHYSLRTEEAYVAWIRRFILFHSKRHPLSMGTPEVESFLTHLAIDRRVAASTQNQAFNALLFLYRDVLKQELALLGDVERAKRPARVPVVLTQSEARRVLAHLQGTYRLMGSLLYGTGMRLMECVRLRVMDVDFEYHQVTVREAKGQKDRVTLLPESVAEPLRSQLETARTLHEQDLSEGFGEVYLPDALSRNAECRPRMGVAIRLSVVQALDRSAFRQGAAPPRRREGIAAGGEAGGAEGGDRQARHLPHLAPFVCHPPAGERL